MGLSCKCLDTYLFWIMPEQCLICMCRPPEVRIQCGHLWACAECIRRCDFCAICREPIFASYNVRPSGFTLQADVNVGASGSGYTISGGSALSTDLRGDGCISSGSESYKNTAGYEVCYKCSGIGTLCFRCSSCSYPGRVIVCTSCRDICVCPCCHQRAEDDFDIG